MPRSDSSLLPGRQGAFTLPELLVVVALMGLLAALAGPALRSLQGNRNLSDAAYEIGALLEQARTRAMGGNTHVFLGIAEYDAAQPATATPQAAGNGRIVVGMAASGDGTACYDIDDPATWAANYSRLAAAAKPRVFEGVHLCDYGTTPPASGPMARPVAALRAGSATFVSSTPFGYPLGASPAASTRYSFAKVIDFDPQGVARVITTTDTIPSYIEIDLQGTRGNAVPPSPTDSPLNYAAIQCDGMSGAVRIYR